MDAGAPAATCVTGGATIGTASDEPWRVPDAVGVAAVEPGVRVETETFGRRIADGTAGRAVAIDPVTGGSSTTAGRVTVQTDTSLCRAVIGVPFRLLIDVPVEFGEIETEVCGDADPLSLRGLFCLLLNGPRPVVLLLFFVVVGLLSATCDLLEAIT